MAMRRITIDIETIEDNPKYDITIKDQDGEKALGYRTADQIYDAVSATIYKALESF